MHTPTARELLEMVKTRGTRILVPIDRNISPWSHPKFFELSHKQAVQLVASFVKSPAVQLGKIGWTMRTDGSVAIVPKERWQNDHDHNGVPHPKPPPLPHSEDQRPEAGLDDGMPGGLTAYGG